MERDPLQDTQNLLFEFFSLYHQKFIKAFHQDFQACKCTKNQKMAMVFIKKEKRVIPTDLGKVLDMRKGSLTALVDSLEAMNLVRREADPQDRRKVLLTLTPAGEAYYEEMMKGFSQNFRDRFQSVSKEEIEEFHAAVGLMVSTLKKL